MEVKKELNITYNPYELEWDDTISFPNTRSISQFGNRIYNRYPARSIFLVPRATLFYCPFKERINVLDPFMGSGTTAVEANLQNCNIYGVEMDPFARLISEVSIYKFSKKEKQELIKIYDQILNNWKKQKPLNEYYPNLNNIEYWFDNDVFNDFLMLKSYIYENITNEKYLKFFKIAFADSIKPSSKLERQSTKPYISSKYTKKIKPVEESFKYSFNAHLAAILSQSTIIKERKINWLGYDATDFNTTKDIDIAITSPPYLNAFDYTQIIKIESAWLGILTNDDIEKLRRRQVGHKKRRNQEIFEPVKRIFKPYFDKLVNSPTKSSKYSNLNIALDCLAYFNDMYKNLKSVYSSLKNNGEYHLIIGDNEILKVKIPTHKLIAELSIAIGFNWIGYYKYPIKDHRTSIPRKSNGGKIKYEYVIILKK